MALEVDLAEPETEEAGRNAVAEQGDVTASLYQKTRMAHWNHVARQLAAGQIGIGSFYHKQLAHYYSLLVPPGMRVLEVGCATGDLLAALKPSVGVGVDFSNEMIQQAKPKHPELRFVHADAHDLLLDAQFDVIILSDLVNDLWDVQAVFKRIVPLTHPRTRLIINSYSYVWAPLLAMAQRAGLGKPNLEQNWLTTEDIINLLRLTDFEVIKRTQEILLPLPVPLLSH